MERIADSPKLSFDKPKFSYWKIKIVRGKNRTTEGDRDSSLVVGFHSPYFRKAFSSLSEGSEKVLHLETLDTDGVNEAALVDLIRFCYNGSLEKFTKAHLKHVLMLAYQYEVKAAIDHCWELLGQTHLDFDVAMEVFVQLKSGTRDDKAGEKMLQTARDFLIRQCKNTDQLNIQGPCLPLPCIEEVLSSDELEVCSEEDVLKFALELCGNRYPNPEERKLIFSSNLAPRVRFPFLNPQTLLNKVLLCSDLETEVANRVVIDALLFE